MVQFQKTQKYLTLCSTCLLSFSGGRGNWCSASYLSCQKYFMCLQIIHAHVHTLCTHMHTSVCTQTPFLLLSTKVIHGMWCFHLAFVYLVNLGDKQESEHKGPPNFSLNIMSLFGRTVLLPWNARDQKCFSCWRAQISEYLCALCSWACLIGKSEISNLNPLENWVLDFG